MNNNELRLADLSNTENRAELEKVVIRPLLHQSQQKGNIIELRLGNKFTIVRRDILKHVDLTEPQLQDIFQNRSTFYLPYGEPLILHPSQFVVTSTLEYISIPEDLLGLVLNRSGWRHVGMVLAATQDLQPGFKGPISLELTNFGNAPVHIYPGSRICNLILWRQR